LRERTGALSVARCIPGLIGLDVPESGAEALNTNAVSIAADVAGLPKLIPADPLPLGPAVRKVTLPIGKLAPDWNAVTTTIGKLGGLQVPAGNDRR
jgi:hypothetical protein